MQIPVTAGIVAHDRHIIGIRGNDGEILRIQALQVFIAEHTQPPSRQTTHPEPSRPDPSVPLPSFWRNTSLPHPPVT